MNVKAEKYNKFLQEKNIKFFQSDEIKDEMNSVVYRSFLEVNGQNLPIWIGIDDSIYVMIHVRLGVKLLKDTNKEALLTYFNALNSRYKVFKYYANNQGDLIIESCLATSNDAFVPEMIHVIIDVILKHLIKEYPVLMKTVWGN